jgi:hypothetical protein
MLIATQYEKSSNRARVAKVRSGAFQDYPSWDGVEPIVNYHGVEYLTLVIPSGISESGKEYLWLIGVELDSFLA